MLTAVNLQGDVKGLKGVRQGSTGDECDACLSNCFHCIQGDIPGSFGINLAVHQLNGVMEH